MALSFFGSHKQPFNLSLRVWQIYTQKNEYPSKKWNQSLYFVKIYLEMFFLLFVDELGSNLPGANRYVTVKQACKNKSNFFFYDF